MSSALRSGRCQEPEGGQGLLLWGGFSSCSAVELGSPVFITVLTLFLTLFFSRLHFRLLINFGIFLTVPQSLSRLPWQQEAVCTVPKYLIKK